jgi:hypothetical protein
MKIPEWLRLRLLAWAEKIVHSPADFSPGPVNAPFFRRWYIVGPNRYFNVWLHYWLMGDQDLSLHDHSMDSIGIILSGSYVELLRLGREVSRNPGAVIFRRAETPHRVIDCNGCVSLFITGPRRRQWGFTSYGRWKSAAEIEADPKLAEEFGIKYWRNPEQESKAKY